MIPKPILDSWRKIANWPLDEQVEQDLIICRALVELFNHPDLKDRVAFRGGTALHKLIFPKGLRYSEDIDLNRLDTGSAGEIIDAVRDAMKDMLGKPSKVDRTKRSVKFYFKYDSIAGGTKKLKIEINVRETLPQETLIKEKFEVHSDYFSGVTEIVAFDKEEMIGTKIRALYQRKKGRDLFDLFELSKVVGIDWDKVVLSFKKLEDIQVSAQEFIDNLDDKMKSPAFIDDIKPLLPSDVKYDAKEAHKWFLEQIVPRL